MRCIGRCFETGLQHSAAPCHSGVSTSEYPSQGTATDGDEDHSQNFVSNITHDNDFVAIVTS